MTPCIEWEGYRAPRGYGMRHRTTGTQYVHRQTWVEAHGSIPSGMVVMHLCDNPPCYRLDHLRVGTHKENMEDCAAKGRTARNHVPPGELSPAAKLTWAQVDEIRALKGTGVTGPQLGERYGVCSSTIYNLWNGQGWQRSAFWDWLASREEGDA